MVCKSYIFKDICKFFLNISEAAAGIDYPNAGRIFVHPPQISIPYADMKGLLFLLESVRRSGLSAALPTHSRWNVQKDRHIGLKITLHEALQRGDIGP